MRDINFLREEAKKHHVVIKLYKRSREVKLLGTIYDQVELNNRIIDVNLYKYILLEQEKINMDYVTSDENIFKNCVCSWCRAYQWKIVPEVIADLDLNDVFHRLNEFSTVKKEKKKNSKGGIYGIYVEDQLIYIGITQRDFNVRWQEHKDALIQNDNSLFLYRWLRQNGIHKISFKKLIDLDNVEFKDRKSNISKNELESMEFALIHVLKPICNLSGNSLPYIWN